jgi:hypothetical protein
MEFAEENSNQKQKQKLFLHAEAVYRFLLEKDENIDTLILCKNTMVDIITSDQALYEAIGSIEDKSKINFSKLVKLLEVVEIVSAKALGKQRNILIDDRVNQIRGSVSNVNTDSKKNNQKKTK